MVDTYSETVGSEIDKKFNAFSFGTNTRHLTSNPDNPFRRDRGIFLPNSQHAQYPGLYVPPCTFDAPGANSAISVSGRLKDCYDPVFSESVARWSHTAPNPPHSKKYITSKIGFDLSENN